MQLSKISTYSDLEIVKQYRKTSDNVLIGELYKRHTQFVFLISMKYMKDEQAAQDIVMEVFEKLFEDLKNHNITNFKSWLYSVTKNQCLQKLRKQSGELKKQEELKINLEKNVEFEPENHLLKKEETEDKLQKLEKAIDSLKKEQKTCIKLFYLEQKSYNEIADETGYELKKVKSYIQNGKRKLKIFMESSTKKEILGQLVFFICSLS